MPSNAVVLGAQWGDEGKGKVVDSLSAHADYTVRYQGGHNAGHTLVINGTQYILHLLPSGIMHQRCHNVIGNGVVIMLDALLDEIRTLESAGVPVSDRLSISGSASLILPSHVMLDQAREHKLGQRKIGTTGRGIGPAYEDKVARRGLRLADLADEQYFLSRLESLLEYHNFLLTHYYRQIPVEPAAIMDALGEQYQRIAHMVRDTGQLLRQAHHKSKKLIFEGAQGAMLDVDHGTYPFVTSSNTLSASVSSGSGVHSQAIDAVIGITKAYATRVGAGPFPTELHDQTGAHIADRGHEFGATTGRARRCGWLDLVALKQMVELNNMTQLCVTKVDVLNQLETIQLCIDYKLDNTRITAPSFDSCEFRRVEPVYRGFSGWQEDISRYNQYQQLPAQTRQLIEYIEQYTQCPVSLISTGPERDAMISR